MQLLHDGNTVFAVCLLLPLIPFGPIFEHEAAVEFALAVSYLPVGPGRAQARPFFLVTTAKRKS